MTWQQNQQQLAFKQREHLFRFKINQTYPGAPEATMKCCNSFIASRWTFGCFGLVIGVALAIAMFLCIGKPEPQTLSSLDVGSPQWMAVLRNPDAEKKRVAEKLLKQRMAVVRKNMENCILADGDDGKTDRVLTLSPHYMCAEEKPIDAALVALGDSTVNAMQTQIVGCVKHELLYGLTLLAAIGTKDACELLVEHAILGSKESRIHAIQLLCGTAQKRVVIPSLFYMIDGKEFQIEHDYALLMIRELVHSPVAFVRRDVRSVLDRQKLLGNWSPRWLGLGYSPRLPTTLPGPRKGDAEKGPGVLFESQPAE